MNRKRFFLLVGYGTITGLAFGYCRVDVERHGGPIDDVSCSSLCSIYVRVSLVELFDIFFTQRLWNHNSETFHDDSVVNN